MIEKEKELKKSLIEEISIKTIGGSLSLIIPSNIAKELELQKDDTLTIGAYKGKKGKFIAIFDKNKK